LSSDELNRTAELSKEQLELANQANKIITQLNDKAIRLHETNEDLADALSAAAKRADDNSLRNDLSSAATKIKSNQIGVAVQKQDKAMATIDDMMEALSEVENAKARRLQRQLEDLVQTVEVLIIAQNREIDKISQVANSLDFSDTKSLLPTLSELNANTLAVVDFATEAAKTGAPPQIAQFLLYAAERQSRAIHIISEANADWGTYAKIEEDRSLARLLQALKLAERERNEALSQETEAKRDKLRNDYQTLLHIEEAIRKDTVQLLAELQNTDMVMTRKMRQKARVIASKQLELQHEITKIATRVPEISGSVMFNAGHKSIVSAAKMIANDLHNELIEEIIVMRESDIINIFSALLDALQDDNPMEDEFATDSGNSSGGGGQAGGNPPELIPQIAEIKLINAWQKSIYDATRGIDEIVEIKDETRAIRVQDISKSQTELFELANEVLTKLQKQGPPEVSNDSENTHQPGGAP